MTSLLLVAILSGCSAGKACLSACGARDVYRRQASNAVMTVSMLERLFDALAGYAEACGGYPASLAALEAPARGAPRSCERLGAFADAVRAEGRYKEGDPLGMFDFDVSRLSGLLATGVYHEYRFHYVPWEPQATGCFRRYTLSADPVERGETGFASFRLSEGGEVRQNRDAAATEGDAILRTLRQSRRPMTPSPVSSSP
jgi:hypothetical protein